MLQPGRNAALPPQEAVQRAGWNGAKHNLVPVERAGVGDRVGRPLPVACRDVRDYHIAVQRLVHGDDDLWRRSEARHDVHRVARCLDGRPRGFCQARGNISRPRVEHIPRIRPAFDHQRLSLRDACQHNQGRRPIHNMSELVGGPDRTVALRLNRDDGRCIELRRDVHVRAIGRETDGRGLCKSGGDVTRPLHEVIAVAGRGLQRHHVSQYGAHAG